MRQVRTTHPYGFRSGEWAIFRHELTDPETGRRLYLVEFPDYATDLWVADDPDGQYEFRDWVPPESTAKESGR